MPSLLKAEGLYAELFLKSRMLHESHLEIFEKY
jgi:hypothetical protein